MSSDTVNSIKPILCDTDSETTDVFNETATNKLLMNINMLKNKNELSSNHDPSIQKQINNIVSELRTDFVQILDLVNAMNKTMKENQQHIKELTEQLNTLKTNHIYNEPRTKLTFKNKLLNHEPNSIIDSSRSITKVSKKNSKIIAFDYNNLNNPIKTMYRI